MNIENDGSDVLENVLYMYYYDKYSHRREARKEQITSLEVSLAEGKSYGPKRNRRILTLTNLMRADIADSEPLTQKVNYAVHYSLNGNSIPMELREIINNKK